MPYHRLVKGSFGFLALSSLLITSPLRGAQARHSAAGFQGTISFYAQTYNPTKSMVLSAANPTPRRAFRLVADAWEKQHPGVHIKFISGPSGDYYTWARTVLTGEAAPDIMWWQSDPKFIDTQKVVQLDSYLNKPNPYNPSGGNWIDTFQPPYKTVAQTPNHHYGWVPMDLVSTGVFYNKALLKKVGINPDNYKPATWAAWMADLAKVQKAGYAPFCSLYSPLQTWPTRAFGQELLWRDIEQYDTLRYQPNHVPGTIDEEEMVRAVLRKGYLPSKDQGLSEWFRVMKDWTQYYCKGWASQKGGDDFAGFIQGKTAFLWEGTWVSAQVKNDPRRSFDYGTFWVPTITKETSPAVHNPPYPAQGVGGYGSLNYTVTKSAVKDGSINLAVDFLQYATSPNNDSLVVNEQPQFVVAVKGAPDKSGLSSFFAGEKNLVGGTNVAIDPASMLSGTGGTGGKWTDKFFELSTEYYQGQRSLDSLLRALDVVARTQAAVELQANDKTKTKLGTWDTSKW